MFININRTNGNQKKQPQLIEREKFLRKGYAGYYRNKG